MRPSLAVTGDQGEEKAAQLPEVPLAKATTESALRATIVATSPAETVNTDTPVTLSYRDRAQAGADALGAKITAALSGPSLWHSPPKSLEAARTHHHAAAGHWEAQLMQGLRLTWGYIVHLPVKGAGHLGDWLTESPITAGAALVIYIVCHYWLLHWLPWF